MNTPTIGLRACPERSRRDSRLWVLSQATLLPLLLAWFKHPEPLFTFVG